MFNKHVPCLGVPSHTNYFCHGREIYDENMNLALAAQAVTALSTSLKPAAPTWTYNKLLSVMGMEKAFRALGKLFLLSSELHWNS